MINFYANDFGILLRSCAQKNYENSSIFVKVTAKKPVAPFFLGHGVYDYVMLGLLSTGKKFTTWLVDGRGACGRPWLH